MSNIWVLFCLFFSNFPAYMFVLIGSDLEKGARGDTGASSSIFLPFQVRLHLEQTKRVIID